MNARRVSHFLQSMSKSCDLYSDGAAEERAKLHDVTAKYKALGKAVHRTLNVVPRKAPAGARHPRKAALRGAPSARRAQAEAPAEIVVRPAPFPVKNYILPAQPAVGPRRYFRSRATQRAREREQEFADERAQWPDTTDPVKPVEEIQLRLVPVMVVRGPSGARTDFANF
jgi:hypothetical protein